MKKIIVRKKFELRQCTNCNKQSVGFFQFYDDKGIRKKICPQCFFNNLKSGMIVEVY